MKEKEYNFILGNGSEQEVKAGSLSLMLESLPMAEKLRMQRRIIEERSRGQKVAEKQVEPQEPETPISEPAPETNANEEESNSRKEKIAEFEKVMQRRRELIARIKQLEEEIQNDLDKETTTDTNQSKTETGGEIELKDENKLESGEVKFFGGKYNKTLDGELPSSSGARFKVFNIKGDQAEFEYCGESTNENYFEEVASIQNDASENISARKEIITVKPGIVMKNSEGKWEVKTPAQIMFVD